MFITYIPTQSYQPIMAKFNFNTDENGNIKQAACSKGLVLPMLSREISEQNQENGIHLPSWLGVMTEDGLFNFSLDTNGEYAEEIRGEAMILSEDPTEIGCEVEIQGNKVYYEDTIVGRRRSYHGQPVPLEDPSSEAVQLVMKINRSGRLVVTNNKVVGRGTQGTDFKAHGRVFLNNFAEVKNLPDGLARLKMYLMFVNWLYPDAVSVDWSTPEVNAKPGQGENSEKAALLIERMDNIWNGVEEPPTDGEDATDEDGEGVETDTSKLAEDAAKAANL